MSGLAFVFERPIVVAEFFLRILGSFVAVSSGALPLACGAALLVYSVGYAIRAFAAAGGSARSSQVDAAAPSLEGVAIRGFCVLAVALIAVGRAETYQSRIAEMALDGRYRPYALILVALFIIDLVAALRVRISVKGLVEAIALVSAMFFNERSFVHTTDLLRAENLGRTAGMRAFVTTGNANGLRMLAVSQETVVDALNAARASGSYRF